MGKYLSALLLVAAVAACSDSNGPDGGTASIQVDDDFFSPSELTIDVGTTVTWTWVGEHTHNVVFAGGGSASPDQSSGTWQRTFNTAGAYSYSCTHHNAMNGEIIVQ